MNSADKRPTPVEQHLGDRLAALIDGELGHDARERVLSHLATCWSCKAEADAQRRLKSVFADTAPPPPSDGLLARLQGLPAGGDDLSGGPRGGVHSGALPGPGDMRMPSGGPGGVFGGGRSPLVFAPLPGGGGPGVLAPAHGARSHRDHYLDRSASRGRRFAFAAAGAFSMAALALTGTVGGSSFAGSTVAAGERGGSSVGQARPAATTAASDRESRRRASAGSEGGGQGSAPSPAATASVQRQGPVALMAAVTRGRPPLAPYSLSAPSSIRPPRVLPSAPQASTTPPRTPSASAAPAPTPALPIAGPRP